MCLSNHDRSPHDLQGSAAHAKLDAWLTKSGKTARGPRWEVYTTTPLTTPDPDAQVTQLVIPVQP